MSFIDEEFPKFSNWNGTEISWLRPSELCDDPHFIDDDFHIDDIDQGQLGDCWFLASIAAVVDEAPDKLRNEVLGAAEQMFNHEDYDGRLEFTFYDQGEPVTVEIDDTIPCWHNGAEHVPIFCTSNRDNKEFWSTLLEKAFAKMHGGYKSIEAGKMANGISYLTGFLTIQVNGMGMFRSSSGETYGIPSDEVLIKYIRKGVACGAGTDGGNDTEDINGIVLGHAYTVLGHISIGGTDLAVLANPHGQGGKEWMGPWSDNSAEWDDFPDEKQQIIDTFGGTTRGNKDGVFCMTIHDFRDYFENITFALNPECFAERVNEMASFAGATEPSNSYYIIGDTCQWQDLHSCGLPIFDFEKEFDDSEVSITMCQRGKRRDVDRDVCFGYEICLGETSDEGRLQFNKVIKECTMGQKSTPYYNEQRSMLRGLPAGSYKLVAKTFTGGFEGDVVVQIYEQTAEPADRHMTANKFSSARDDENIQQKHKRFNPREQDDARASGYSIEHTICVGPIRSEDDYLEREEKLRQFGIDHLGEGWDLTGQWHSKRGTSYVTYICHFDE